jgi:hypothetical protein
VNQLDSFEQKLVKLSANPRQLEVVYIETKFKYTDEDGMGNGKSYQWQIATFSHPAPADGRQ